MPTAGLPTIAPTQAPPAATQPPATEPPAPTATPAPTAIPTPLPTVEVVRPSLNSEQIWRSQQQDREPFSEVRQVRAPGKLLLWWFDPLARQHVALGWIGPEFQAQARFRLAGSWVEALEVPYHVNQSYGLVLTDAVLARMRAAGYTTEGPEAWLETYVYAAPDLAQ